MKKLILILSIIFVASVYNSTEVQAQSSTPLNEMVLTHDASTLIENVIQGLSSTEERKINVTVEDQRPD